MKKKEIFIPKFHEAAGLVREMEAWKAGDHSRARRRKLVMKYKDHFKRGFFMKEETKRYIEQEVLPLMWNKTYRNIKHKWLKALRETAHEDSCS